MKTYGDWKYFRCSGVIVLTSMVAVIVLLLSMVADWCVEWRNGLGYVGVASVISVELEWGVCLWGGRGGGVGSLKSDEWRYRGVVTGWSGGGWRKYQPSWLRVQWPCDAGHTSGRFTVNTLKRGQPAFCLVLGHCQCFPSIHLLFLCQVKRSV